MKKLYIAITLFALSCSKSLPNLGNTATVTMSHGWWMTLSHGAVLINASFFMNTYNTAPDDADSLWIDDLDSLDAVYQRAPYWYNIFGIGNASFKCKVAAQYRALTFQVTGSVNDYWTGDTSSSETIGVFNGKILPGAAHNPSGQSSDSIQFQIVYSKNPVDTFVVAGKARTGFVEDEP